MGTAIPISFHKPGLHILCLTKENPFLLANFNMTPPAQRTNLKRERRSMTLTIEIPDELAAALQARAQAEGLSPDSYVGRVLENTLADIPERSEPIRLPLKTGRGMWARYGPAPSAEEIDQNRKEMLSGFARD
jgi:predicted DNA binding CopG/RHH family protein